MKFRNRSKRQRSARRRFRLGRRVAMEPLENRRLLAAGDLVGIDFGPTGDFSPVNWNQSNGGGNVDFILDDLIDESGLETTVSLEVAYNDGTGVGAFPSGTDPNLPTHSNPLNTIGGVLVDQTGFEFTFSGLNPGASYEVYVFGGDPANAFSQNVTIVGESTIPFTQNWVSNQFVNSQPMSTASLDSFAELVAADAGGQISITVESIVGPTVVPSLAIREVVPSESVTIDGGGNLTIRDTVGADNEFVIQSDVANDQFVISDSSGPLSTSISGASGSGTNSITVPFAEVTGSILVDAAQGNDTLTIDFNSGDFANPIDFIGGDPTVGPGDTLALRGGGTFADAVFDFFSADSGAVLVSGNLPITYSGLEPIDSQIDAENVTLNYSDAAETITIEPDPMVAGAILVDSDAAESLSFGLPSDSLTINGGDVGDNSIEVIGAIDLAGASFNATGDIFMMNGSTLETNGTGAIEITAERNVLISGGATLSTVDGSISIFGNRDATAPDGDFSGITINGSTVTSSNGDILLEGSGGNEANGSFNRGIFAQNGALIESTGTGVDAGTITLLGHGPNNGGGRARGIQISGATTRLSSVDGDIVLIGTNISAGGDFNQGIAIFQGIIESTGTGPDAATIVLDGTGGQGVASNQGVFAGSSSTIIQSIDGDISITGQGGGTGNFSTGVQIAAGAQVLSTGTGPDAATITIDGTGGDTAGMNRGIALSTNATNTPSIIQSVDGDIQITGRGGNGPGGFNQGILWNAAVAESTGTGPDAATITVNAIAGAGDGTNADAGLILQNTFSGIRSVDGDIDITGVGANTGVLSHGVLQNSGAVIESTGTTLDAANITIHGSGGSTVDSDGVRIGAVGSEIRASAGDIQITGDANPSGDDGVSIENGALIESTGTGDEAGTISIFGTGGDIAGQSHGIVMNTGAILSVDGEIALTGTNTTGGNRAVSIQGMSIVSASNTGDIRIDAIGISPGIPSLRVGQSRIGAPISSGDITLTADGIDIGTALSVQSSGILTLKPTTPSIPIGVAGPGGGPFNLNDSDFVPVVDGFDEIIIGDVDNGTGHVTVHLAVFSDPIVIAGGSIDVGTIDAGNNDVELIARTGAITDSGPFVDVVANQAIFDGQVSPGQTPGILEMIGDFTFADNSSLSLEIGGLNPGVTINDHDQIDVAGTVTIGENVALQAAAFGGFVPTLGSRFVIIENDGADPVVGQFAGLPEGAVLNNFLGSNLSAVISYQGVDGNDVTLTPTIPTVSLTVDETSIMEDGGVATFSAILSGTTDVPVTVDLNFDNGTAIDPDDYVSSGTIITINPGELSGTVTVTAQQDDINELEEIIEARIETSVGAGISPQNHASVTIEDNDFLLPLISTTASDPTNVSPIPMAVDFQGVVSGFDVTDLQIAGGVASNFVDNGDGTFTFDLVADDDGLVTVNLPAAAATDLGGKNTLAAAEFSIVSDVTPPTPVITGPGTPMSMDPFEIRISFGEVVTGFIANDITVTNGRVLGFTDNGGGNYSVAIDAASDGSVTVEIPMGAAADLTANESLASNVLTVLVDSAEPIPVITTAADPTNADPISITIDFGEVVTGFELSDLIVVGGTVSSLGDHADGTFTAFIASDGGGSVTIDVPADAAFDVAMNPSLAATPLSVVIDTLAPTPAITSASSLTQLTSFDVNIDFGESVIGFVDTDISVGNGSVVDLQDHGNGLFTATVNASADGDVTIDVDADVATDAAGNGNLIASPLSVLVDTTAPSITPPSALTTEGDTVAGSTDANADIVAFLAAVLVADAGDPTVMATHDAPSVFPLGDTVVVFSATDSAGNTATANATVTVTDTTGPTITLPADLSVEGDTVGGAANSGTLIAAFLAEATASDVVDDSVTVTNDAPSIFPVGDTVVTFSTMDDAGNVSTATATLTVTDATAPVITAPADISLEGDATGGASEMGASIVAFLTGTSTTDIVDDNVSVSSDAPSTFPVGDTLVTFTAMDDAGNETTATATVTVTDSTPPILTPPANVAVEADASGGAAATGTVIAGFLSGSTAMDIVDDDVDVTNDAPATFPLGATLVTFTAIDDTGNESTATATVSVTDATGPTITVPADISIEGDSTGGALNSNASVVTFLAEASGADVVDGTVTVANDAPAIFPLGDTLVTFTATDSSGNETTATATVTVVDSTAPIITAPEDLTVEGDAEGGAAVNGATIAAFLSSVAVADIVDDAVAVSNDAPETFPVGDTVVTFTATDSSGNESMGIATVSVTDTTLPAIIAPADIAVEGDTTGGADAAGTEIAAFLVGAAATDIVDDSVTVTSDAPGTFPLGDTIVTFTAMDDAGNESTATATVTVSDSTGPMIMVPTDITVEGDTIGGADAAGTLIAAFLSGATAADIVDDTIAVTNDAPATFPLGSTVVTFRAMDDEGNESTATATVSVIDSTSPAITAPDDVAVEGDVTGGATNTGTTITAFLTGASVTDVVDDTITVTTDAPDTFPLGDTVVTFTASDETGNTSTASATVSVTDTTPPVVTAPDDISVEGDVAGGASNTGGAISAFLSAASVTDLIDDAATITDDAPATFPLGDTLVTFTAVDVSGNSASSTATVTVSDSVAPTIVVPDDLSIEANVGGGAEATLPAIEALLIGASAADTVDTAPTISNDAPQLFPIGETTVTFTAIDSSGNSQTATAVVTVTSTATSEPSLTVSPSGPQGAEDPEPLPGSDESPTSWTLQRSDLRQIVVGLGRSISTIAASDLVLTNLGMDADNDPDTVITLRDEQLVLSSDGLTVTIELDAGQLTDGVYQIDLLANVTGGDTFSIVGNETNRFYALTGDWNGSGAVNIQDFATFAYWFGQEIPTAPQYVDLNNTDAINIQDFAGYAGNFGNQVIFPSSTATAPVSSSGAVPASDPTDVKRDVVDLNGDGSITTSDAAIVIDALMRDTAVDGADVSGDGVVDATDALQIVNRIDPIDVFVNDEPDDEGSIAALDELLSDPAAFDRLF